MLTGTLSGMGSLSGAINTRGTLNGVVYSPSVGGKINNPILQGLSAYEVAVANGFEGTEAEWLASLAVPYATATVAGIMKLYDETGENTDGSMTQRAVTHEIRDNTPNSIPAEDILFITRG